MNSNLMISMTGAELGNAEKRVKRMRAATRLNGSEEELGGVALKVVEEKIRTAKDLMRQYRDEINAAACLEGLDEDDEGELRTEFFVGEDGRVEAVRYG